MSKIWLAGGCFWGVEAYFQQLKGVLDTTVGYGQGQTENPTYEQVCSGLTGHTEICEVVFDDAVLPLAKVLEHYFRIIDPTTLNRQGPDCGTQYRTGIYYADGAMAGTVADYVKAIQARYAKPVVVETGELTCFYPAEAYHQDYLRKNPRGYCHINLDSVSREERK